MRENWQQINEHIKELLIGDDFTPYTRNRFNQERSGFQVFPREDGNVAIYYQHNEKLRYEEMTRMTHAKLQKYQQTFARLSMKSVICPPTTDTSMPWLLVYIPSEKR
jgi:hypothetical protein